VAKFRLNVLNVQVPHLQVGLMHVLNTCITAGENAHTLGALRTGFCVTIRCEPARIYPFSIYQLISTSGWSHTFRRRFYSSNMKT